MTGLDEPVFASEITPETDQTQEELKAGQAKKAVQARKVRREALKDAGADLPPSRTDLHAWLEHRRKKDRQKAARITTAAQIARQAVERKVKS